METNRLALETGYEYIKNNYHDLLAAFTMPELENPQPKLFMLGNEAVALGALTSGAKFMSAYPITPSSEIMEYMVKYAPAEGGGSNRPGGNDGDPAGRDRYAERRPQYRPADQA